MWLASSGGEERGQESVEEKKKNNFTYKWVIYVVDEEERTLHVGPTCTLNPKPPSHTQREREGEGEGEGGRDWIHDFLRWGPRCHTLPSLRTSSLFYSKINYREGGGNKGEERRCQRSP